MTEQVQLKLQCHLLNIQLTLSPCPTRQECFQHHHESKQRRNLLLKTTLLSLKSFHCWYHLESLWSTTPVASLKIHTFVFHSLLHQFSTFQLPSTSDISDLICNSKSCQLDLLPTVLVKTCLPSLLPLISAIIHSLLRNGIVHISLKTAVTTIITTITSNLPFLYKIIKKIAATQIH